MIETKKIKKIIIDNIYENIASELKYKDFILIGSNMRGKSKVIKDIINLDKDDLYFIDSVNRIIPNDNPSGRFVEIQDIKSILKHRREDGIFNTKDKIDETHNNSLILKELIDNLGSYKDLLNKYFECNFKVKECDESDDPLLAGNKVYKYHFGDNVYDRLSNGYQAIIRIIVELKFASDRGCKFIIIDEIDSHLDKNNCLLLIEFIRNEFSNINFLITTHSPNIILNASGFNIIKINKDDCEYFDSNDMDNLNYINRMLFRQMSRVNNELESKLTNYIRLLTEGYVLTESDKEYINSLEDLTTKQKLIKKYILNW